MSNAVQPCEEGPLHGVRIVDWTVYGVGPFATALLGALGADVVKIENTERGDLQQYIQPTVDGVSALYVNFNTSKRCIQLDLRSDEGRAAMWTLIEGADLLVNNFRESTVERLGFSAAEVLERNPGIVYVLTNGWGEHGPRAGQSAGDNYVQAFCGWCSINGVEGGRWELQRYLSHIDLNTSLYVAAAALSGLLARPRAGGQAVRLSMLEAALAMQATRIAEYLAGGTPPRPLGSAASVVAPSQAFLAQDHEWLAVSAETDGQWQRLCDAIERPDLAARDDLQSNAQRVARRAELAGELQATFATRPAAWWLSRLATRSVPSSRFWDPDLIRAHAHLRADEQLVKVGTGHGGLVDSGGPPWRFAEAATHMGDAPRPGEHTAEVIDAIAAGRCPWREERAQFMIAKRGDAVAAGAADPRGLLPCAGLRVVELATGIAGPTCGSLLADLGAEVVKVEPPEGDRTRGWGPPFLDGVGAAFNELNRNKRLQTVQGAAEFEAVVQELLLGADVVIADAVDPAGEAPAVDLVELRERRPEVVVCTLSAYGERGCLSGHPGSELTVQAMCNTWAGLGRIGEPPLRLGADQASSNAGVTAFQGIVAALLRRERTGRGDAVKVSLLGTHHAIKGMHWTALSRPEQWPGLHLGVWTDPPHHGIQTADRPILLTLNRSFTPPPMERVHDFMRALGVEPNLELDPRAAWGTPPHPMHPRWLTWWGEVMGDLPWGEVARIADGFDCEVTPFMDYPALDADAQVATLGPFVALTNEEGRRVVRLPWRFSVSPAPTYHPVVPVSQPGFDHGRELDCLTID